MAASTDTQYRVKRRTFTGNATSSMARIRSLSSNGYDPKSASRLPVRCSPIAQAGNATARQQSPRGASATPPACRPPRPRGSAPAARSPASHPGETRLVPGQQALPGHAGAAANTVTRLKPSNWRTLKRPRSSSSSPSPAAAGSRIAGSLQQQLALLQAHQPLLAIEAHIGGAAGVQGATGCHRRVRRRGAGQPGCGSRPSVPAAGCAAAGPARWRWPHPPATTP